MAEVFPNRRAGLSRVQAKKDDFLSNLSGFLCVKKAMGMMGSTGMRENSEG